LARSCLCNKAENRDQLWAEAVHLYRSGEQWHLTDEEEQVMRPVQAEKCITPTPRPKDATTAWLEAQRGVRSVEEWTEQHNVNARVAISSKTMERRLKEAGAKVGHGRFRLPPPSAEPVETEAEPETDKWTNGQRRSRRLFRRQRARRRRSHRGSSAGGVQQSRRQRRITV